MSRSIAFRIRRIFLDPRPDIAVATAARLLEMSRDELMRDIVDGVIVATSTSLGWRIGRQELIAAAMQRWEQAVIEEALGDDAATALPEAIRLVELRARVPRYLRELLRHVARRLGTSVDEVLTRELEGFASAQDEETVAMTPPLPDALAWPSVHHQ